MARIAIPNEVDCPHCQARNPKALDRCQACGRSLAFYIGPAENFPRRLDLRSIMVVIALVAACLVVTREVPPLGIFLMIISVPALLRTFVWTARMKGYGRPMLWPERLGAFTASLGIVWLIVLGASAAFALACTAGTIGGAAILAITTGRPGNGPDPSYLGIPLGGIAAGFVIYALGKVLWPVKD